MKFNSFGTWDVRSVFSLGISIYIGTGYLVLTIMLGPITRSFEIHFG